LLLPAFVVLVAGISLFGDWRAELIGVVVMPVLVAFGSRATTRMSATCEFLGRISFPAYAIHLPILVSVLSMPFTRRMDALITLTVFGAAALDRADRITRARIRSRPLMKAERSRHLRLRRALAAERIS
jgi:peptidoglycan/LPS O-acetylase OafA/YrhL